MPITLLKKIIPASTRHIIGRNLRNLRRRRGPPVSIGRDFVGEIKTRLPSLQVNTIFDVGAYEGILALEYSDRFPSATVYAFEPATSNMRRFVSNLVGKPDIRRHKIAFGNTIGNARLLIEPNHPSMARLTEKEDGPSETVAVDTVDNFCSANKIASIDLMKIDTEGYELSVLSGAKNMLFSGAIKILKLECTADPANTFHTQFSDICGVLYPLGYKLFGIYDQAENPLDPKPALQRFDCAFISQSLAERR